MSYIKVKHNLEKHVIISYMQMGYEITVKKKDSSVLIFNGDHIW